MGAAFAAVVVAVAACTGKETTAPPVPTTITASPASLSFDALGATQTIAVMVLDQHGAAMPSVAPTVSTEAGDVATVSGSTSATVAAVGNGSTNVVVRAGNATARVPVTVSQVALAPIKVAGDAQTATVGAVLANTISVKLQDRLGNAVAGRSVTFAPAVGSGTVSPATVVTSTDGTAATAWTVGTVPGAQTLTASTSGVADAATFAATATVGPPAKVTVVSGDLQVAVVGSALTTALAVRVADVYDNPITGAVVNFAVTAGSGAITGAIAPSNALGVATAGAWTLGTVPGPQAATATVSGVAPKLFSATATVGSPASVNIVSGNNQSGVVGSALSAALTVRVADVYDNPVPGVTVVFSTIAGSGTIAGVIATTTSLGIATSGAWTLGTVAGFQNASAIVAGVTPRTFTATATAGPPAGVATSAGDNQTSGVGTVVPIAPAVRVTDAYSNPVSGTMVTFAVTAGGGSVAPPQVVTNAQGIAGVGAWTLGTAPGAQTLTATVSGLPARTFNATAVVNAPSSIVIVTGDGQSAMAGFNLPTTLSVIVRDRFGNLVSNAAIAFQSTVGGGTLTPSSVVTNASGVAGGVIWRLGPKGGTQNVTASANGASATFGATVQSSYPLTLRFFGPAMSLEAQTAFSNAANRLRAAIVNPVSSVTLVNTSLGACGVAGLSGTLNESSTGVIIYASVASIDGPGRVLAQAGPCYVRGSSNLPVVGVMQFDDADIQTYISTGRFEAIVLHEMSHVLGFGTIWTDKGLLSSPTFDANGVATGSTNPRFTGASATSYCGVAGGAGAWCTAGTGVAVEATGGSGTVDSHWRESLFVSELMTGWIEGTSNMPWSAMTIAQFFDLGYTTNLGAADPFTVPSLMALARMRLQAESSPTGEVVHRAKFEITPAGTVRPMPAPRP